MAPEILYWSVYWSTLKEGDMMNLRYAASEVQTVCDSKVCSTLKAIRIAADWLEMFEEIGRLRNELEQKQGMIDSLQEQVFDLKERVHTVDRLANEMGKARNKVIGKYNHLLSHVNKAVKELNEGCSVRHLAEPFRG